MSTAVGGSGIAELKAACKRSLERFCSCLASDADLRLAGTEKEKIVGIAFGAKIRFTGFPVKISYIRVGKYFASKCWEHTCTFTLLIGGSDNRKQASHSFRRLGLFVGRRWKLIPGQGQSVLLSQSKAMQ